MDQVNIAWFAGIFEADGNARISSRRDGTVHGCVMSVTMIQKDVLELIKERTGLGYVLGPYGPTSAGNPTYKWQCTDRKELARICLAIYPLLGKYKSGQIETLSEYLYDHLPRMKVCIQCGKGYMPNPFRGSASRSKYCESKCVKKAYKERMKLRKAE